MDDLISKRLQELYYRANSRGYNTYSDFLNMEEQSILQSLNLPCVKYGGYGIAERVVAGFGDDIEDNMFPIKCICIKPLNNKFADKLTHRDFLGGLMNLGIKRELLGDIIIKDNCGYLFCLESIADYICDSLSRLKHTSVEATVVDKAPDDIDALPDSSEHLISSCRVDVIISAVYKLSRSEASALISREKVFINSKAITSAGYVVKLGDIISTRGYGRIKFIDVLRKTKKDRIVVELICFR